MLDRDDFLKLEFLRDRTMLIDGHWVDERRAAAARVAVSDADVAQPHPECESSIDYQAALRAFRATVARAPAAPCRTSALARWAGRR